ncbi:response regulator [Rickettsiella massiliensis]|uniref:response regulator n=1 Tax=Rickettsiella massiliensis TaxID=676517 RepID=UPI000299E590|nr:response regulator transcription factor [Rickettsiella massiliensis]
MRILLVEDDESLGEGICKGLKHYGYTVDWLTEGKTALSFIKLESFDVILLDLNLPGLPGLTVLNEMRAAGVLIPVLILTARHTVEDKIKGLDSGADDYLAKPFDLAELSARIRALQRRFSSNRAVSVLTYRDIELDSSAFTVTVQGRLVNLSRREFSLLQKLLENPGHVISRDSLNQCLYGWDDEIDSNTLEVHVHNLRKKLAGTNFIRTIRGVGYMAEKETL